MIEDAELLRCYVEERSEGAFAQLVKRRVGLVYSVAVRQCGGDTHLAEDVTQRVFAHLARKAKELARRPVLSGWLYRSAQFAASDVVRGERRRRAREEENHQMSEISNEGRGADSGQGAVDWGKLRSVLDEAMGELGEEDRDAVALRFFEEKSFAEIGGRFALSEAPSIGRSTLINHCGVMRLPTNRAKPADPKRPESADRPTRLLRLAVPRVALIVWLALVGVSHHRRTLS